MPALPRGIKFQKGSGSHKYTAVFTDPSTGKTRRVSFGHKDYQHYKDSVPKSMGGGIWSKKDHKDPDRRASYRARHGALKCKNGTKCITVKYSPAWFSYYYLW